MAIVEIIGVPTSAASFAPGQEKAPQALRRAGIVTALEATGHRIIDRGDPPIWRWRPDPTNRYAQNLAPAAEHVEVACRRIKSALEQGHFPLVLGGNCTIAIAAVAAVASEADRVGLIYLDRHCDLNVPAGRGTTGEGALDWMGVAHMLGIEGTLPELARLGPRFPLLGPADVFYLGIQADQLSSWEIDWLGRLAIRHISAADLAVDPHASAQTVLATWAKDYDRIVIHFDVDVIDFVDLPLGEAYHFRNSGLCCRHRRSTSWLVAAEPNLGLLPQPRFDYHRSVDDSPDIARVASLVGDPARGRMLTALMEGRALTATELALEAGIAPSTASSHLEKLTGASLLTIARQGRHHYFRIAGPEVAAALEGLMAIAPPSRHRTSGSGARGQGLRRARVCYDHLAGEAGVGLLGELCERKWLRVSRRAISVTPDGETWFRRLGVDVDALHAKRRPLCRACLDWSERRFHLAGSLGAALLDRLFALRWARRETGSREVTFSPRGAAFLENLLPPHA